MENKSLVALMNDYQRIMNLLLEANGELSPELETALAVNQNQLAEKADRYDFFINKLETESKHWAEQAARYSAISRVCDAARDRMREAIKGAMRAMDLTEIVGENVTFKLTNSTPRLVINGATQVPVKYITETVVREIDKEKIKADLKAGIEIPNVKLEPSVALRVSVSRRTK